jgi:hypothetical protein
MRVAIDTQSRQTSIISVVGYQPGPVTPKKVRTLPIGSDAETVKQTHEIKTTIPYMRVTGLGKGQRPFFGFFLESG